MTNQQPDLRVYNEGTIVQFEPVSEAAKDWIDENVQVEGWKWLGNCLCVEPRDAEALIARMMAEGLTIQ